MAYSMLHKPAFKVDIMRDRNIMYRETDRGVENLYQLHLLNATEKPQHYRIRASGMADISIESEQSLTVGATEEALVPLSLAVPHSDKTGSQRIRIEVTAQPDGETVTTDTTFYLPK
jgi:polyferredoxin